MSEFFALARAMEEDAASRYTETARHLRQQGVRRLADVFDHLAEIERGHVAQVNKWAERETSDSIAEAPWPIPDTFDAPPEEVARSKLMTPYGTLAFAVRHEQRSFAFWTYVAAHADNGEVKYAAERMALEELEHVSILRRERRQAFHSERQDSAVGERPVGLGSLGATERRLADLIERHPECAAGGRSFASMLAASSREAASKLEALGATNHPKFIAPSLPADRTDEIAAIAEYLAEAYLRLADASQEGSVLDAAQELAKVAVARLGMLDPEFPPKALAKA